jgi:hypothetical protein
VWQRCSRAYVISEVFVLVRGEAHTVEWYFGEMWLARLLFQRGVAAIYLLGFVSALNQFRPLLGERGLLPVPALLARVRFFQAPSLFHVHYSDRLFAAVAWSGIALSVLALLGLSEAGPTWLSFAVWFALWVLYLSIVNVGQTFYGFGWESMLLEAGFFACFLGPSWIEPSPIPILALRWMLFRTELGAGLIKLRHDACWRDLTCLYYHYETQPVPNPLSWYFHRFPKRVHRAGVLFSHFVQIVVPFGLFAPQPIAAVAGALIIGHQLLLIVSGNYAWLNWLTVVLGVSAFDDSIAAWFGFTRPMLAQRAFATDLVLYALAAITLLLSIQPARNLVDKHQRMNFNYNPLHIVNAYGAFGSVTRERYEIVLEGAAEDSGEDWREYGFRAKPVEPTRRPPQVAPYHLRLDWLMWFLPLRGFHEPPLWFERMVDKLLLGDRPLAKLFRHDPFPNQPPARIRALVYRYEFSDRDEREAKGAWWRRERVGEYWIRSREEAAE